MAQTTCPSCKYLTSSRNHCAGRPNECGWSRCGQQQCNAVWRNEDRHIMAPQTATPDAHG